MAIKIWTSQEKSDDKIIAFLGTDIYKANPPADQVNGYVFDLKMNNKPLKNSFEVPLSYISEINLRDRKKYIEVVFRGDYEYLKVSDDKTREEIFGYFKENIPGAQYGLVRESKIQSVKKPLIAVVVVSVIYLWALFIAIEQAHGTAYDVPDQHYHSIAGIILLLAGLGVGKLTFVFGCLFAIAITAIVRKYRNPLLKRVLYINRK